MPVGVTSIDVELVGGRGGRSAFEIGGLGDRVTGTLPVSAGATLYVRVGGNGSYTAGGYNGGGAPGTVSGLSRESGGGGATDVRTSAALESRLAVAGGGGGAALTARGGDAEQAGTDAPGEPGSAGGAGTQSSGGAGGISNWYNSGAAGVLGMGGAGGSFLSPGAIAGGSGGGGGYYGGGGGVSNGSGSGGGGSSLVPAGGSRAPVDSVAVASITYEVPIATIVASAPDAPALQSTGVSATAYASSGGHSAPVTSKIAAVSAVSALSAGGQPSDVTCATVSGVTSCVSTRAGQYTLRATFGAWSSAIAEFPLEFTSLTQTIDFAGGTLNVQQPTQLAATSTSGLPVSYSLSSGPCTLAGSTLLANDVGTCSVTSVQVGSNPYLAAPSVTRAFTVAPVTLVASTDPAALTATAGSVYRFPVELQNMQGNPVSPQPVIDYSFAPGCSFGSNNIATEAGSCKVTATVRGSATLTTTFTVRVVAAPQPPAQPDRVTPALPNTGQVEGAAGAMTVAAALALIVLGAGLIVLRRKSGSASS